MNRRRVKITGIGPVTPAGIGREAFQRGINESVSRVRRFDGLGSENGPFVATYMDDFDLRDYLDKPGPLQREARHTQFALAGTALALADAGISEEEIRRQQTGVVMGSSLIDFGWVCRSIESVRKRGASGALKRVIYTANPASIGGKIVGRFGLQAKAMTVQTSCCAGLDSIGYAADLVAKGEVDLVICGGTEAPIYQTPMLELRAAGLTPETVENAPSMCRPFDLWRTTGVVGEGAAVLILEPESSPRPALAWLGGYGNCSDHESVQLSGLEPAIREAVDEARLNVMDIESISAWGPGHRVIDAAETNCLKRIFGSRLKEIAVVSIKGSIGSPLGAAGAIQTASAVLALQDGCVPPTVNWTHPDPACLLSLSNKPRYLEIGNMVINAHGVGGVNSSLVLLKS